MEQDEGGQLLIAPLAVNGVVDVVGTWEVLIVKSVLVAVAQDLGIRACQQAVAKRLFGRGEVWEGVTEEGFGIGVHGQLLAHRGHAAGCTQKVVGPPLLFGTGVFLLQEDIGVGVGFGFDEAVDGGCRWARQGFAVGGGAAWGLRYEGLRTEED